VAFEVEGAAAAAATISGGDNPNTAVPWRVLCTHRRQKAYSRAERTSERHSQEQRSFPKVDVRRSQDNGG